MVDHEDKRSITINEYEILKMIDDESSLPNLFRIKFWRSQFLIKDLRSYSWIRRGSSLDPQLLESITNVSKCQYFKNKSIIFNLDILHEPKFEVKWKHIE